MPYLMYAWQPIQFFIFSLPLFSRIKRGSRQSMGTIMARHCLDSGLFPRTIRFVIFSTFCPVVIESPFLRSFTPLYRARSSRQLAALLWLLMGLRPFHLKKFRVPVASNVKRKTRRFIRTPCYALSSFTRSRNAHFHLPQNGLNLRTVLKNKTASSMQQRGGVP